MGRDGQYSAMSSATPEWRRLTSPDAIQSFDQSGRTDLTTPREHRKTRDSEVR